MKILVTGATGFIGSSLVEKLLLSGHQVIIVTRNQKRAQKSLLLPVDFIEHNLNESPIENPLLDGVTAIVHLMGENIATRWTGDEKQKILRSRVDSTKNLVQTINNSIHNCEFIVSASAIGLYRESKTSEDWLDETAVLENNFLADVVSKWEGAWGELSSGISLSILRFGIVLGHNGGMVEKLLPLYRSGLGGKLASGQQWMSWIHLEDLCSMIQFVLEHKKSGIFNAVAETPIKNEKFNKVLAKYVQRPAIATVPKFALKMVMGEAAILALASQKVSSKKIRDAGFLFKYSNIEEALKAVCCFEELPPLHKEKFHHFFRKVQYINRPITETFEFFSDGKNLEKITPEFLNFKTTYQSHEKIQEGSRIKYKLSLHGIPMKWTTVIRNWEEGSGFVDYQESGPYEVWYHKHSFLPLGQGTLLVDEVKYRLPVGYFGELFGALKVKNDVSNIFKYRVDAIDGLLAQK